MDGPGTWVACEVDSSKVGRRSAGGLEERGDEQTAWRDKAEVRRGKVAEEDVVSRAVGEV